MQFAVLGSGSKGNCSLVRVGETMVMVDCGFALKEVERRLEDIEVSGHDISAIVVTHEHSDHISGVARVAAKYRLPVYMTHGTQQFFHDKQLPLPSSVIDIELDRAFSIGDMQIHPVPVPHDAKEPCQFIFQTPQYRLGMLSDLGHVSESVYDAYHDVDALYIEFNHCRQMLADGPYPAMLKRRVGGHWGHLSNCQAKAFIQQLQGNRLQQVIVGHISEKNNSPDVVKQALSELDFLQRIDMSLQHQVQPWLTIS